MNTVNLRYQVTDERVENYLSWHGPTNDYDLRIKFEIFESNAVKREASRVREYLTATGGVELTSADTNRGVFHHGNATVLLLARTVVSERFYVPSQTRFTLNVTAVSNDSLDELVEGIKSALSGNAKPL